MNKRLAPRAKAFTAGNLGIPLGDEDVYRKWISNNRPESRRDGMGQMMVAPLALLKRGGRAFFRVMANTYSQIYIQIVFAVQGRESLIPAAQKEELHKYITGVVRGCDQKLLAVHCMPDHTHMLVGLKPAMALSDLVKELKASSSRFIKTKRWVAGRFTWQEGFGAFSYGHSQIREIIRYIARQPERHARTTFRQEYVRFLKKFEVEHDDRFIFKDVGS